MYACIHPLTTNSGAGATRATPWACWRRWRLVVSKAVAEPRPRKTHIGAVVAGCFGRRQGPAVEQHPPELAGASSRRPAPESAQQLLRCRRA